MPSSFIDSPFPTRAAYDAAIAISADDAAFAAAERACAEHYAAARLETEYVGRLVALRGLKAKPELNGKRGRAVRYDATSGRVGVSLKTLNKFGGVERAVLALLPANLMVVAEAADELQPREAEVAEGEVSWAALCHKLDLAHHAHVHWSTHEEKLANHLMGRDVSEDARRDASEYLEAKVGMTSRGERERLIEALVRPASDFGFSEHSALTTMMKLFSRRMAEQEKREERACEPLREARDAKSKGVPTADMRFRDSPGRVCEQTRGRLDERDNARPPLDDIFTNGRNGQRQKEQPVVYPTSSQVDQLAELLRTRCRTVACFGSGPGRLLDGMLENRGINVMAFVSDTMADADEYYEERVYCRSPIHRIGVDCLMHFERPLETALVFVRTVLQPWRAYLARYPTLPLVIVIGDDSLPKLYEPKPIEPAEVTGLRLLRRSAIDCHRGGTLDMAVYERVG